MSELTATLEVPQPAQAKPKRDRDKLMHHRVTNEAFLDSVVNGTRATALCGHRFRVSVSPQMAGTSTRPTRRCPECERIRDLILEFRAIG